MTTDEIAITGIRAVGHHGVYAHERRDGQEFVADVVLALSLRRAAATDDVADTVHYGELAEQVAGILSGDPVDLLETVAERIAAAALAYPVVDAVTVTVHKPQAPIAVPFGDVSVTVRRTRDAAVRA
jgi:dihydroneopterin aldolase